MPTLFPLTPEARYMQLGQLMAETPDFAGSNEASPERRKWLARAVALAECGDPNDMLDAIELKFAVEYIEFGRYTACSERN